MYISAIHDIIKTTRARAMAIEHIVVDAREKSLNCVFMLINDETRDYNIPILIILYHLTTIIVMT